MTTSTTRAQPRQTTASLPCCAPIALFSWTNGLDWPWHSSLGGAEQGGPGYGKVHGWLSTALGQQGGEGGCGYVVAGSKQAAVEAQMDGWRDDGHGCSRSAVRRRPSKLPWWQGAQQLQPAMSPVRRRRR